MSSHLERIIYIQYTNPGAYPPLEHSSRILADAGWTVLFLGTGSFGASPLKLPPHPNITVKQLAFCPAGLRQKCHYLIYCFWVLGWVCAWRPRWVYASDPLSCPIALALDLIPGLRIIYHEHDSPASTSGNGPSRVVLLVRRLLAKRACCSVLPNETRVEHFQGDMGKGGRRVVCVWNCPRQEEISRPRPPTTADAIWLLYHGSIGPVRLPLSLVVALAKLPDSVKLRVIGYETVGTEGHLNAVRERARTLGISHRVELLGPMPRVELLQHCRKADIGIALVPMVTEDINMRAMSGASNKAFDYLACGLALLVSDLPEWRRLFVQAGYGVACNPEDPATIERALTSLLNDRNEMRAMGERGRQRISREWNYETQFAKVFEHLNG